MREALVGATRFSDFQRSLDMARNVLTNRLEALCEAGILSKHPQKEGSSRSFYVLTPKGSALFPVVVALGQWGDKWIFGSEGEPVRLVERMTEIPLQEITVATETGQTVTPADLKLMPGPGAEPSTRKHLKKMQNACHNGTGSK